MLFRRTTEFLTLFIGIPLFMMAFFPIKGLFAYLCLCGALCTYALIKDAEFQRHELWHWKQVHWDALRPILIRFFAFVIIISILVYYLRPDLLYNFPRQKPERWAIVMLLYPLLSVYPQEIIFRSFFMHRYRMLFKDQEVMKWVNGFCFGFAHIFMMNWLAPVVCGIGGVLFASTYQKSRSLALVSIEHSLYGCWVFTIGLGYYFYSGAVR